MFTVLRFRSCCCCCCSFSKNSEFSGFYGNLTTSKCSVWLDRCCCVASDNLSLCCLLAWLAWLHHSDSCVWIYPPESVKILRQFPQSQHTLKELIKQQVHWSSTEFIIQVVSSFFSGGHSLHCLLAFWVTLLSVPKKLLNYWWTVFGALWMEKKSQRVFHLDWTGWIVHKSHTQSAHLALVTRH